MFIQRGESGMKAFIYSVLIGSIMMLIGIYLLQTSESKIIGKENLSFAESYDKPDSVSIDSNFIVRVFRGDTITVINLNFR